MDKIFKIKKKQDGRNSGWWKFKMTDIVQDSTKNVVPPYVWMPSVHTQHKESMLCQTKEVSICPIHFDAPICLDAPKCLDAPICLPLCLYIPTCLDAPVC